MNRILAVAAVAALAPLSANAIQVGDNVNLAITLGVLSDYRNLGVSQTQGDPALQMSAVLSHSSGAYLGLWSSSFDFGDNYKAYREDGYYVGYNLPINDNISIDASLARYEYPNEASFDTNEVYVVADVYKFKLGYLYDFDVKDTPNLVSYFAGYTFDLPMESSLLVKYGYTDYNFDIVSASGKTRQTYNYWEAKLSKNFAGIDWSATFTDTDMSKYECAWVSGADDLCGSTVIFAAQKTF